MNRRENAVGTTIYPDTWDLSSFENLTRHVLIPNTDEYTMVANRFNESLRQSPIVQIERIQNCRQFERDESRRGKVGFFRSFVRSQVGFGSTTRTATSSSNVMVKVPNNGCFTVRSNVFSSTRFDRNGSLSSGCRGQSAEMIIKDCFNRGHATRCGSFVERFFRLFSQRFAFV